MQAKGWTLIDLQTKQSMPLGTRIATFDGTLGTLEWGDPPRHQGSTGTVHVRIEGTSFQREFFPAVIGAMWINGEELP